MCQKNLLERKAKKWLITESKQATNIAIMQSKFILKRRSNCSLCHAKFQDKLRAFLLFISYTQNLESYITFDEH